MTIIIKHKMSAEEWWCWRMPVMEGSRVLDVGKEERKEDV